MNISDPKKPIKTPIRALRDLAWGILFLCLCMPGITIAQNTIEKKTDSIRSDSARSDTILTVDIPAELFMALVSYQELSEAEAEGKEVNRRLIPVLESIVEALKAERRKFESYRPEAGAEAMMKKRIAKLDSHLLDFQKELRYRRVLLEYRQLQKKQKALIEGR